MQLHACLLLFIITTDELSALMHHHCGGNVSLDQEPAGHINLTLPGHVNDTDRLNSTDQQSNDTRPGPICTWVIVLPPGRTVRLKSDWLGSDSNVSVRCLWNDEDGIRVSEGTALLSRCDNNKATLSWRGAGRTSNSIQLFYYVQEEERNSTEDHTSPHADPDLVPRSQTGTSLTSTAPIGQEVVTEANGGRGRLYEGLEEWTGPQSVSNSSSQDQGLLRATSVPHRLTVAGKTDRETLPLPEEEPNNRTDTSGAAPLTDGLVSARERTRPYFQHTITTETLFHTSHSTRTERDSNSKLSQTRAPLKRATAAHSNTRPGTDPHQHEPTLTSKSSITTRDYPTLSTSSIPQLTSSSPPELPPWTTRESRATRSPHGGVGKKLSHFWRSQRTTDTLNSYLSAAVTSDPLTSPTEPQLGDSSKAHTDTGQTASSSSSTDPSRIYSSTTHITALSTAVSFHPDVSQNDTFASTASDVTSRTFAFESSDTFENAYMLHTLSTQTQTHSPQSTETAKHSTASRTSAPFTRMSEEEAQTATQDRQRHVINKYVTTDAVTSSPDTTAVWTVTGSSATTKAAATLGHAAATGNTAGTETHMLHSTATTLLPEYSPTNSPAHAPALSPAPSSTPSHTPETLRTFSAGPHFIHSSLPLPSATSESAGHAPIIEHKTRPVPLPASTVRSPPSRTPHTQSSLPLPSSTNVPATHKRSRSFVTSPRSSPPSLTTARPEHKHREVDKVDEPRQRPPSSTPAAPSQQPLSWTSQENPTAPASSVSTSVPASSSTTTQTPKFYIVPDQPPAVRVESIELLLQIIIEDSRSTPVLEEETAAWMEPYLQRAPGFSRLRGVWSSGHAVQSLVEFKTSGALQWLSMTGPPSLLERTGLAQAVREGRSFKSSKITNITVGGLQADVCDWLLQCQAGYKCVSQHGTSNYSCSSVCRFDYCHNHGICTHHPGQLPVCRCLVGEDFWYMGQRCDVRMTRARLVGTCLAILLVMVTVIGVSAFVAVRRYRAILIEAKVDQTRSSYRRFNHFDELSGRFWLRSRAGSADSLDNPAFTRSDELLHLRALDRPCCYHDDTLSLASTCPSHGIRINTIYPHSSQYGWRGSEMSMGDGVLDSGKASDLSVCSWPVEPIHWTPFPLLQQLASHRTPTVRVSRPRSYCEGMELVDLGKSWTA